MKVRIIIAILLILLLSSCKSNGNDNEWYFKSINLQKLWEINESKGTTQTIAFIDTGITKYAEKLYGKRIISKFNSIDGSLSVLDEHGHGTQMVGIACGNGEGGIYGISPNSKIIIIKAIGSTGNVKPESIKKAIEYAIAENVDVINMSFGSFVSNEEIKDQLLIATQKGISCVASVGDYQNKDILFPASLENVISVAAKDKDGSLWFKSNISKTVITAFPGVGIKSFGLAEKPTDIIKSDGTSQATAIASGYIALLRDYLKNNHINFDNKTIIEKLKLINAIKNEDSNYTIPFIYKS